MQAFPFYLKLGFEHISNLAGLDHILFLVALCAVYRLSQWRSILTLVTAFTVGHTTTLALVTLGTIKIPSEFIEFLIPTTILITAIGNVMRQPTLEAPPRMRGKYLLALFFGFIHGMGFSNYFRALLMDEGSVAMPLFAFNLGIELGQLLVVAVAVGLATVFMGVFRVKHRDWNLFVSGAAFGLSAMMMIENRFW
ncbi:MAG: HupE/UreJ family protein [Myxococcota bacterium]